jgi:hypothetical protein
MVTVMTPRSTPAGDRIIEPLIALAQCAKSQRILVAGSKSIELTFELQRRGYARVSASANCGRPAGQYDVALVDWRQRTFRTLETTLDWLASFLGTEGVLVVWVDSQKPAASRELHTKLEQRGFLVEAETLRDDGAAVLARRREINPVRKAA